MVLLIVALLPGLQQPSLSASVRVVVARYGTPLNES